MAVVDVNLNGIDQLTLDFAGSTTATILSPGVVKVTNTPPSSAIVLETNGTPNGSQTKLNLVAGTNITLTDDGSGDVTLDATGGGGGGSASHFVNTGSSPAIAGGSAAGSSPSASLLGGDSAGIITIISGASGSTSGQVCAATFAVAFAGNVSVVITPINANAAGLTGVNASGSSTGFNIFTGSSLSNGVSYQWSYIVIGI